jgi:CBS domain containing-hemolysin-like protein
MPRPGDRIAVEGYDFTVVEVRGRRVTKVLVAPRGPESAHAARGG